MVDRSKDRDPAEKPKNPDDFEDAESFLAYVRALYNDDWGADQDNREEALEDAKFVAGDQWDHNIRNRRERNNKPTLTINRLPAFVAQLVGNRRQNRTIIKAIATDDRFKKEAEVRDSIIRTIQANSNAKRAFDQAYQNQIIGGVGYWRVELDYATDDAFDQEIKISRIDNPLSVVFDRMHTDPTGADAAHCFVTDHLPRKTFEELYPKAKMSSFGQGDDTQVNQIWQEGWINKDTVRVAEFWRMRSRKRTVALLEDESGQTATVDVTDKPIEEYENQLVYREDGSPIMREIRRKYAEMYLISGVDILEGPYELPIYRVPVFRAPGWEIDTGDYKTRFGLIRWLRDPMRLHNYWRSVWAEKLMMTPKAKWLAKDNAVEGYEDAYRRSHLSDDPLLKYKAESDSPPQLVPPPQIETGFVHAAEIAVQDIRDVSNMHEASFGEQSNEVSGKGILARQRVSEAGTVIYDDNIKMAQEETGKVINQLIPYVYDTPRVLPLVSDDEETVQFTRINYGEDDQNSVDITENKFEISFTTGPSFATKRVEAAESMMAAVNAMPDVFSVAADLIAEAQDWPKADKIKNRIRSRMDPSLLGEDADPEQVKAAQAQAQAAQEAAQVELNERKAEIAHKLAQAEKLLADAMATREKIDREDVEAEARVDKIEQEIESMQTKDTLQTIDALTGENNV